MNLQNHKTTSALSSFRQSLAAAAGTLLFLALTIAGAGTIVAHLIVALHNASSSFHVAAPLL